MSTEPINEGLLKAFANAPARPDLEVLPGTEEQSHLELRRTAERLARVVRQKNALYRLADRLQHAASFEDMYWRIHTADMLVPKRIAHWMMGRDLAGHEGQGESE